MMESFKWTDDEIQLLLEVVKDYQSIQTQKKLDWMKIRSRYEQIAAKMRVDYPITSSEEFPHTAEEITKERVAAKLKKIQAAYKKALDAKRQSGRGGRVVMTLYDVCNDIWGRCPAANSLEDGMDSSAIDFDNSIHETSGPSTLKEISNLLGDSATGNSVLSYSAASNDETQSDVENIIPDAVRVSKDRVDGEKEKTTNRRELIDKMLNEQRGKRLARKRGREDISAQLLDPAKEKNAASNKMFAHIEKMEMDFSSHMQRLTTTMDTIGNSISTGFATLSQLLQQAPHVGHYQPSWSAPKNVYLNGSPHMQQPHQCFSSSASTPSDFATWQRKLVSSQEREEIYAEQF